MFHPCNVCIVCSVWIHDPVQWCTIWLLTKNYGILRCNFSCVGTLEPVSTVYSHLKHKGHSSEDQHILDREDTSFDKWVTEAIHKVFDNSEGHSVVFF